MGPARKLWRVGPLHIPKFCPPGRNIKNRTVVAGSTYKTGVFGASATRKVKYVDFVDLTPGSASVGYHTFVANGLYDPDYTGTGHQPMGFDEIMAFFDHYTVTDATVTVDVVPKTISNVEPALLGIALTDSHTALAGKTLPEVLESRVTQSYIHAGAYNPTDVHRIKAKFSAKEFFGVKDVNGMYQYRGSSSTNPSEQAHFQIFASSHAATPGPITLLVTVEFNAKFTEPRMIGQS